MTRDWRPDELRRVALQVQARADTLRRMADNLEAGLPAASGIGCQPFIDLGDL